MKRLFSEFWKIKKKAKKCINGIQKNYTSQSLRRIIRHAIEVYKYSKLSLTRLQVLRPFKHKTLLLETNLTFSSLKYFTYKTPHL